MLVERVEAALGPGWNWAGGPEPGSPAPAAIETAREREELQRSYFATLLCIASNGLGPRLLAAGGLVLDHLLSALFKVSLSGGAWVDGSIDGSSQRFVPLLRYVYARRN